MKKQKVETANDEYEQLCGPLQAATTDSGNDYFKLEVSPSAICPHHLFQKLALNHNKKLIRFQEENRLDY